MRHDQNGSIAMCREEGEIEVPIVLVQRGRPAKETTARMSYGMARQLMEGSKDE